VDTVPRFTIALLSAFFHNASGTWTSLRDITVPGSSGDLQIPAGMTFRQGQLYSGIDVARALDQVVANSGYARSA
jgi:hypothetical protein